MPREMNMDVQADINSQERKAFVPQASILYLPLPAGKNATGVGKNKLYFGLFSPAAWSMHKTDDEVLFADSIPSDLWTFYWKLHGHYVDVQTANGTRAQFVICPIQQNKYQVETLKYKPLFKDARCRQCEESSRWWAKFNEYWESGKVLDPANMQPVRADRWSYEKDQFAAIQKHPHNKPLTDLRDEASRYQPASRWIFEIFDVSKYSGERPMDEGEDNLDYQIYFGPKTIFDGLFNLHSNGVKFYDSEHPQIILLVKDCSEGVRQTKYSISNLGPFNVSPEELAFLSADSSLRDLKVGRYGEADAIVYALSYNEQCIVSGLSGAHPPNVQVPSMSAAPDTPSAPVQAPMVAPPVRPRMGGMAVAPVVAPPPQVAQVAPVAPVQQVAVPQGVQPPPQPVGQVAVTAPQPPQPPQPPSAGAKPVQGRKRGETTW
jgi:hypothetical protein